MDFTSLPNLHPAVVHFPIALVPLALLFEVAGLLLRKQEWLERGSVTLWGLAGISSWVALQTGESAADGLVGVPANLEPLIGIHSDWGHRAFYALIAFAVLRLGVFLRVPERRRLLARSLLLVPGLALLALVAQTADLGGQLVYRHGVAVHQAPRDSLNALSDSTSTDSAEAAQPTEPEQTNQTTQTTQTTLNETATDPASRLTTSEDGTVTWRPEPGDSAALGTVVTALSTTTLDALDAKAAAAENAGLTLQVSGEAWLTLPGAFSNVRVEAALDLTGFDGDVGLFHHAQSPDVAGLLIQSTDGRQTLKDLRGERGETKELSAAEYQPPGTFVLAVSAAGKHLKGLADGATVTHGHIESGPEGRIGLMVRGEGTVRLIRLSAQPL